MIYITRTYLWADPYLKGLHLTIDGWRKGRDNEGYRVKKPTPSPGRRLVWEWDFDCWIDEPEMDYSTQKDPLPPEHVVACPRLRYNGDSLLNLFGGTEPAVV